MTRTFSETFDIHAAPARVWDVMSDVERWPEWTTSMSRVERLDVGPLRVGSRVRVKQPKLAQATFEVTSLAAGRSFEWITRSGGVVALARHAIAPIDDGSRVTLSVTFSGALAWLVVRLYGRLTVRYIRMEAEGLTRRAEQA